MSHPSPAISVLLSVRNGLPYLPTTVASIRGQTFAEFEFVIVDNASTDGSVDFLRQIEREDPRVRLLLNERDLGHSGGLNRGLGESRGDWIARIDADDVALPNRLERQLAFVTAEPRLKLTSCLGYYIDPEGRRVGQTYDDLATVADFERYMANGEMIGLAHPGAFMAREVAQRLDGYRQPFGAANDIDLWARIAETGALVLVQQERLMEFRIHPGQISSSKFVEQRMQYAWARASARARRAGQPEPSWDEFLRQWQSAPWFDKINRARKLHAKRLYREAGVAAMAGRKLGAGCKFLGAALLQPEYAIGRARRQIMHRSQS